MIQAYIVCALRVHPRWCKLKVYASIIFITKEIVIVTGIITVKSILRDKRFGVVLAV